MVSSIVTPIIAEKLSVLGMFSFFAVFTALGNFYIYFCFKDSSFKRVTLDDGTVIRQKLTDKERKQLYVPKHLQKIGI
jgi:hypothetical protein